MADTKTPQQGITRREFLVRSTVIAGSGFFSIGLPGLVPFTNAEAAIGGQAFTPSIWFTMTPDGKTTMHIVKTEMGQHIGTGLAQVIAEELEVRWEDVRLDTPLESVENFAIYGLAYTVNSGSITTEFDRIARAGAAGSDRGSSRTGPGGAARSRPGRARRSRPAPRRRPRGRACRGSAHRSADGRAR
jgi:hypothetical protein